MRFSEKNFERRGIFNPSMGTTCRCGRLVHHVGSELHRFRRAAAPRPVTWVKAAESDR